MFLNNLQALSQSCKYTLVAEALPLYEHTKLFGFCCLMKSSPTPSFPHLVRTATSAHCLQARNVLRIFIGAELPGNSEIQPRSVQPSECVNFLLGSKENSRFKSLHTSPSQTEVFKSFLNDKLVVPFCSTQILCPWKLWSSKHPKPKCLRSSSHSYSTN